MDTPVQIVLIIAVTVLIILFIFRRQLSEFRFKGGKEGVDMRLKTKMRSIHPVAAEADQTPAAINIKRNRLWGRGNKIQVQGKGQGTTIDDNQLLGEKQEIRVNSKASKK